MYHILPAEGQRQYGSVGWKNQPLPLLPIRPDAKRLVTFATSVIGGVGRMDEETDFAAAQGHVDLLAA